MEEGLVRNRMERGQKGKRSKMKDRKNRQINRNDVKLKKQNVCQAFELKYLQYSRKPRCQETFFSLGKPRGEMLLPKVSL